MPDRTGRVGALMHTCTCVLERIFRCCRFLSASLLLGLIAIAPAKGQERQTFDIDAGPAMQSLSQYAQQARIQLGFSTNVIAEIHTNPVKGEYEREEALGLLLAGTGLVAEDGKNGIVIHRATEPPPKSSEEGPKKDGASPVLSHAAPQNPQERDWNSSERVRDHKPNAPSESIEEILVTGSRIRGAQNSSPVITITRAEIDSAGFSTVEQLVESLPQNFGGGANQENFSDNFGPSAVRNRQLSGSEVSIDLRGLGPDSTLVLLNGRRLAQAGLAGSFVDVSSIPLSAIERIEVLTDGASAVYGADAIAGVVNFILIDDYHGVESRLRYGPDAGTDTSDLRFDHLFGKSWRTGDILFSYEFYSQDSLDTADRPQAANGDLRPFGGDNFNQIGGNPGTVNAGGVLYAIPDGQDGTSLEPDDFVAGTQNFKNRREGLDLRGNQERHNIFLYLQQGLTRNIDTFLEARYSTVSSSIRTFPSTINLVVPNSNPYFVDPSNSGLDSVRIENYSFLSDIGPQVSASDVDTYGVALGVTSPIGQTWDLSLSGSLASEQASTVDHNTVNLVALNRALAETNPEHAFNPFADGSNTNPNVLDGIRSSGNGVDLDQDTWSLNLDISGSLPRSSAGPLGLAMGLEYREESIKGLTREEAETGSVSIVPGIDRNRKISAAYAELFFPLVSHANGIPGLRRLELSIAGRYVDYSDFGGNASPKLGLVWSPYDVLTLRGTVGRSFKPPLMTQLDVSDPRENVDGYIGITPLPAIFRFGGNEDLLAQESTNWTVGLQYSPETLPELQVEATYYSIDFKNRIQVPPGGLFEVFDPEYSLIVDRTPTQEEIVAIASSPRWQGFGTSAEDVINGVVTVEAIVDKRMRNVATSKVSGVDLQLRYGLQSPLGKFNLSLNGSYLANNKVALLRTLPSLDLVDAVGNPAALRVRGGLAWNHNRWAVSTFANFTNSYSESQSSPALSVDSWTTLDLNASYETRSNGAEFWRDGLHIALSVQNALDQEPPFVNRNFGIGFDPANASIFGRYVTIQVAKKWL
jgi:outer membrane receptor protein involved in Fe transport